MDVSKLRPLAKTVASAVGWFLAFLSVFITVTADGNLSTEDLLVIVTTVLSGTATTAGVYGLKNTSAR